MNLKIDKISDLFIKLTDNAGQRLHHIQNVNNNGSDLIQAKYPHLWSQLLRLTYNWSLTGKFILHNAEMLKDWLKNQRELANLFPNKTPITLPAGVTIKDYKEAVTSLHTFLQDEVLPVLERVRPKPDVNERQSPQDLGFDKAFDMDPELKDLLKEVVTGLHEEFKDA